MIIRIKETVDALINWVIKDYLSHENEENSWLYLSFSGMESSRYKVYTQLKDLLLRTKTHPRKLETRLMFDPSRAEMPTIHVHMPSEEPVGGNFMGMGSQDRDITENGSKFSYNYSKDFSANYDIIITSNNPMEVLILYEFLKRVFIAGADTLVEKFDNFNLSGKELLYDSTLMPNIFFRAFSCKAEEKITIPSIISREFGAKNIIFEQFFIGMSPEIE